MGAEALAVILRADERGLSLRQGFSSAGGLDAKSPSVFDLSTLAGRMVEIVAGVASAALTAAMGLVLDAQRRGEPAVWIATPGQLFYPPDAAASGVDLAALAIVRVPDARAVARATVRLAHSGAFGLLIVEPRETRMVETRGVGAGFAPRGSGSGAPLPAALATRLAGLARTHDTAIVFLVETLRDTSSPVSQISLRAEAVRLSPSPDFRCEIRILKDKRQGAGRRHTMNCRAPAGLCGSPGGAPHGIMGNAAQNETDGKIVREIFGDDRKRGAH